MNVDWDKWAEILNSIRRHKLRTALTAFGVFWGIFMLILLLATGNGLQNGVERMFRDDAVNSIWIWRGNTSIPYKGLPEGREIQLNNDDHDYLKKEVKGVEYSTGRYYIPGAYVIKYKKESQHYDVRSVHPEHQFLENTIITEGRFINDEDINAFRKVAVIGAIIQSELFKDDPPIGTYIEIKGVAYQVVGIFKDEGNDWENRKVYIPVTSSQRVYGGDKNLSQIMVTTGEMSYSDAMKLEEKIKRELSVRHNFDPLDEQAIEIRNNVERYEEIKGLFWMINAFVWFVGIGSILAGVIGISNIMLIVVKDRTKEIGIRKALGATPGSILSMIVQEAILVTSIAGYAGMFVGVGLVYLIKTLMLKFKLENMFFREPEVDVYMVLIAMLLLVVAGAIAGLIPALQAVRIKPVIAMKS